MVTVQFLNDLLANFTNYCILYYSNMSARSSRQDQEVSGSSSGFTEEEILTELHEMGYTLKPEQISELKKGTVF